MCRLSWNLVALTSWNLQGLSRPVMGLLYLDSSFIHWRLQHCAYVKKLLINTNKYSSINKGILTCDSLLSWYNVVARTKSQPAALSWHVCIESHSFLSWGLDNISVCNFYCRIHKPQLICRCFPIHLQMHMCRNPWSINSHIWIYFEPMGCYRFW